MAGPQPGATSSVNVLEPVTGNGLSRGGGGGDETLLVIPDAIGPITLDVNTYSNFWIKMIGDVALTFQGGTDGRASSFSIAFTQDVIGNRRVTWPSIYWVGGVVPDLTQFAESTDIFIFLTYAAGLPWWGGPALMDVSAP